MATSKTEVSSSAVEKRTGNEEESDMATTTISTNNNNNNDKNDSTSTKNSKSTPQEEIERQHQQAVSLCDEGLMFHEPTWFEELPLSYKRCLLLEKQRNSLPKEVECKNEKEGNDKTATDEFDNQTSSLACWSSRGRIDITDLQNLVREGYNQSYVQPTSAQYPSGSDCSDSVQDEKKSNVHDEEKSTISSPTNLWDPANAAKLNVSICRPSHDQWGILKIMLVFCDDFCQRVLELPWWHARPDIRAAIQPILDVLNIQPNSVLRILLASLPPGVTIPIHQDSGEWVQHTHRVHCPVLVQDPSKIMFLVGNASKDFRVMQRIETSPGHVFEINNQGWHFVSNCDSDHRVHLILDYVDETHHTLPPKSFPISRFLLQPGETLFQTRRSVDRRVDAGKRPTPSYFILGAQKAGTTSLYNYMIQHPLVIPARRRETHSLDWRWNDSMKTTENKRKWCHHAYYTAELKRHPSCLTGDSTPSYLLDSKRVIPRMKLVFDHKPLKFFVILRDPVKRVESHFAMVTSPEGTPAQLKTRGTEWREKTIEQVINEELSKMKDCGLIPYFDIESGQVDDALFQTFSNSKEENSAWDKYLTNIPLNTGSHCLLGRGLYELNLRPWLQAYDPSDFFVIRLESMKDNVQTTMQRVWAHLDLPRFDIEDDAPKNTREYDLLLTEERREYLRRFFKPHNQRLASVLGEEWRNAWCV